MFISVIIIIQFYKTLKPRPSEMLLQLATSTGIKEVVKLQTLQFELLLV